MNADGLLSTVRYYQELRAKATDVLHPSGSTLDVLVDPQGSAGKFDRIAICHMSAILVFTVGGFEPSVIGFETSLAILLAIQHLNTGNGSLVPQVEGLPERCPVRFTTEMADTQRSGGTAIQEFAKQIVDRDPEGPLSIPSAVVGASYSSVSVPLATVTGFMKIPQISGTSTTADLEDTVLSPLFARTIPSDGTAVSSIRFLGEVLQIKHLAVINVNDAFGNTYVDNMRKAIFQFVPDMELTQVALSDDQNIPEAVSRLAATKFRYIFTLVFGRETNDALMLEAHRQGIAGSGLHNWFASGNLINIVEGRSFSPDDPLFQAYR